VEPVGTETVVYDLESKDAHCLKPVAAFVFAHCDGERTIAEITELAEPALESITQRDVVEAVTQLEALLLLEPAPQVDELMVVQSGLGRREMLRRIAFAGAAATAASTMVTTIAAPTALAACSGQQAGCNCSQNKQCSSGHCCGSGPKCNVGCCSQTNNGADCMCLANHTCASIPAPTQCCAGVCVPNNPVTC
jgi:hypothetical protein